MPLGNGVGAYLTRPLSVRQAEDELMLLGYDGIEFFEVRPGEVGARSRTADGYKAEAIGKTRELAARALVTTITRK